MTTNQDFKNAALDALKGNWAPSVLATVIYLLIASACVGGNMASSTGLKELLRHPFAFSGISSVFEVLILYPLSIGVVNAFRVLYENGNHDVLSNMFKFSFTNYLHILWTYLLMTIKIILWSLLLIIPGIIKSFSYSMAPYIAVEHPELTASQAIAESKRMMHGHKFDLFWLYLSFIGWGLLCICTLCIGFFWLIPYMETAQAAFYSNLKASAA